jgi:hypothetical protein
MTNGDGTGVALHAVAFSLPLDARKSRQCTPDAEMQPLGVNYKYCKC